MKEITFEENIKFSCPNIQLGCLAFATECRPSSPLLLAAINSRSQLLQQELTPPLITKMPLIASARKAYQSLGKDPSRYRLAADALLRRVVQGKGLYQINNIVDTLNLISIKTGCSIGGYDLDQIEGNITLGIGQKGETYEGIGRGNLNIENLPILRDNKGAFGNPTSDSTRTMIRPKSKHFLLVFFDFGSSPELKKIVNESLALYQKYNTIEAVQKQIIR